MRMTEQQFDTAVEQLQQNQRPDSEWLEIHARIVIAACFVIKQRQGVPDEPNYFERIPVTLERAAAAHRLAAPPALGPTASMYVPVCSPTATQAIFDLWETVIVWGMSFTRTMCSSLGMARS
jgi:hypothetical protein